MEINKRIEIIRNHYDLTNTEFADKINVQPSSLSHIFSGRNKPSIDFILKLKIAFPDVSLDWIIIGEGSLINNSSEILHSSPTLPIKNNNQNKIEKIAFFYKNGHFEIYYP